MSRHAGPARASFFPTPDLDHAAAGLGAGTLNVLCMHPLDLLKVRLQVSTAKPPPLAGLGNYIWRGLADIKRDGGWRALYRGVGPNVAGNASSWGLYFLFYNYLKRTAIADDPAHTLSAGQYLLYSAEASAVTAIITNPIWVVKVRMFTTSAEDPTAYRSMFHGLKHIYSTAGLRGLWRGTSLALVGVGNGAIQFTAYEEMKRWGFERKRRRFKKEGREYTDKDDRLSNTAYTVMSSTAKLFALASTYPYQVVRSRIQNNAAAHLYPTIWACVRRTFVEEGAKGFYRGLGTNLVRVLPGTCVTFVVYENLAWLFRTSAGSGIGMGHLKS